MFLSVVKQEVSRVSDGHSPKSSVGGLRSLSVVDQSVQDDLVKVKELSVSTRGTCQRQRGQSSSTATQGAFGPKTVAVSHLYTYTEIYIYIYIYI